VLLKFEPDIITVAPIAPLAGLKPVINGEGNTVKFDELFTVTPLVVMEISPEEAPAGTVVVMVVAVEAVTDAFVPLNVTEGDALKLVPVMITVAPTAPLEGLNPVMVGEGNTVKFELLKTVIPFTVKEINPVPAPTGTVVVILFIEEAVTRAITPLNRITLLALMVLKLFPEMVMVAPTAAVVGLNPVMFGVGNTVKSSVLVTVTPLTVTVIFPVVAPAGTEVLMLFVVDPVTVAIVLLNLTT
jgi:hypothetical protein